MDLRFEGQTALVTGAAGGIGRAAAERLQHEGATVVMIDRDSRALLKAADDLKAIPLVLDVTDRQATERALVEVEAAQGPISVLIAAAGLLDPPRSPARVSEKAWNNVFAGNVDATRIPCIAAGTRMAERGYGSIVMVASIAASDPGPLTIYGPAKAALVALMKSLAGAWGRSGVRVNAVAPGYVETSALNPGFAFGMIDAATLVESTALGRLPTSEEVARAIAFIASDAASAITGAVVPVDAGHLLSTGWACCRHLAVRLAK